MPASDPPVSEPGSPSPGSTPPVTRQRVTMLLAEAQQGRPQATDELFPIVYQELHELAERFMHRDGRAHTLQATALVHEAYLRLVGPDQPPWENRAHFFGAAARAIRRILIDHARRRGRQKRGGNARRIELDESMLVSPDEPEVLLEFDEALARLAELDAHKARVVELRFFAGLTVEQTAMALGVSPSTIARDWQFARVWLFNQLRRPPAGDPSANPAGPTS